MSLTRLLTLGPALLATCVCTRGGAEMVGSGIRSPAKLTNKQVLRRAAPIDIATAAAAAAAAATAVAAGAASTTAVAAAGGGGAALTSATREAAGDRIIIGGPASCEAPSALVPGIRTRGGAITEGPGPNDYSSTLKDQSQPWWTEDKKTHLIRTAVPKKSGGFSREGGAPSSGTNSLKTSPRQKNSLRSLSGGARDLSEDQSLRGWAVLAAAPVALLAGKFGGGATPNGKALDTAKPPGGKVKAAKRAPAKPSSPVKAAAKPAAVKPAKVAKMGPQRPPNAVAAANSGRVFGGERLGKSLRALVPHSPNLRAACIVALGALGSGGLYALASNNLLRAAWPISFLDPWQVLTASAWAGNMMATFAEGRLDGSSSTSTSSGNGGKAKPSTSPPVRFFTPASWAFTIWAPIFLGEMLFVFFQLLPMQTIRGSWWLSEISPWFAGAMLFQTLWCASYRPWARDAGLLWLPTLMLGGVAVALGGAHAILREAWFSVDMNISQYLVTHLPISLHFGWISCASLVNLNGFLASISGLSDRFKLVASMCTVFAAVVLGVGVTLAREDPLYAAVVAWALWAVGSPAGWGGLRGRVDPGSIRAQEISAKAGAVLTLAAGGFLVGLHLKDALLNSGMGAGTYDEEY